MTETLADEYPEAAPYIQQAFAIAVLQTLRDIVLDMKTVDPYFEEIRNAREQPATTEDYGQKRFTRCSTSISM